MVDKNVHYLMCKGGVFYFTRHVPNDLQRHYETQRIVICLKTRSKNAALKASQSIASKLDDFWLQMRIAEMKVPASSKLTNKHPLNTSFASCRQLANGEKELLKAFLDVKNIDEKSIHEARRIYSNLDIDEFYEWASDHFGLDTYYEDSEDLVDHIKIIFRIDDDILENNEDYKFVTKMIGRSEPSFHYMA